METLNSSMGSENQFNQRETESIKRKPLPKTNGPQFTIPRLKKIKRDLLTELPVTAHECQQEILSVIRNSFHFQFSALCHTFSRVQSVHNPELTAKYLERRRDMKSNGYPDALVSDTYAFLPVDSPSSVDKLCRDGVRCGNQQFSGLGVSHMAVHACKHADILTPVKPKCGDRILLMVKILKGKVKAVLCKNVGAQLEPTPNYDCHIAKPNVDQAVLQPPHMLFYSSQFYVYEYGDFKVEDYPRQVLPYAIVYYTIRDPHVPVPKNISSLPHPSQAAIAPPHKGTSAVLSSSLTSSSSSSLDTGPNNEVWRGRLHVQLTEGGHIYIEVVMLSYFVPLTISLISPIKVHSLYPEHNAQFTFFCGLTNIACKDEVEWRAHYFRSCVMRPRPNNEEHFKALVKHISVKKEMPAVRLPHDVFLFLMPDCLLASQLGLVRRDDDSPVLHCVIMSKYSTSQSQTKRLMEKNIALNNYGSATSWENLFDDSDLSDDEEQADPQATRRHLRKSMATTFHEQRYIHNKLAAMSLADAEINFAPCACKKLSSKTHGQRYRDDDIGRVYNSMQSASQSSQNRNSSCFPPGSRHRPKQKLSRRAKAMPSFSPHGSSDSDTDTVGFPNSKQDQYSLLNNTKTVEEELSEEELTNEQMEDIIFLRKPVSSASSLTLSKSLSHPPANSSYTTKPPKQPRLNPAVNSLKPSYSSSHSTGYTKSTQLSSQPKLIPTEPLQPAVETTVHKPKVIPVKPKVIHSEPTNTEPLQPAVEALTNKPTPIPVKPKVIPCEPVNREPPQPAVDTLTNKPKSTPVKPKVATSAPVDSALEVNNCKVKEMPPVGSPATIKPSDTTHISSPKKPKSILKSSAKTMPTEPFPADNNHPLPIIPPPIIPIPLQQNDFGDVDMRVPSQHSTDLHPVFLSAVQSPPLQPPMAPLHQQQFSPNLSFGSWLAPGDIQQPPPPPSQYSSPFKLPVTPTSPPAKSPLSPTYSPASPPLDSPASPPSPPAGLDSESPASPPQSVFTEQLRSSPVAIPTSRIHQHDPAETYHTPFVPLRTSIRCSTRERIDNADDMKNFLNSGFDSDLDSSYEEER